MNEFVIPRAISEAPTTVIEVIPAPVVSTIEEQHSVIITPDMRVGIGEEYVSAYEASPKDAARARAIAGSVLRHSWFLSAGRHARR